MKASWRYAAAVVALALASGCGGGNSALSTSPQTVGNSPARVIPDVVQTGNKPINWTQFADPLSGFGITYSVVMGSDANMYVGNSQGGLMQIKMTGAEKLIAMQYSCNGAQMCSFVPGYGMVVGADKKFYMGGTNFNSATSRYVIGVATTAGGAITTHDIASSDYNGSGGFTVGPDHNVWYTEQKHIAKITTGGAITEYSYPSGATANSYGGVTTGPDGNVWFTEYNNQIVAKIVPSTGTITEYSVSALGCNPTSIVSGGDGNLYFACSNYMGQITTAGVSTRYYDAYGISYLPQSLQIGPDGNIWFPNGSGDYVSEFNPSNISFTTYVPPYTTGTVYQMALGPDGNFWANESDLKIDVYILKTLGVTPSTLSFTATGQTANLTVKEPGTTKWTATSVSTGVCSVAQGSPSNIFVVTAKGGGSTKITVKDAIGNSFVIPCKVT